MTELYTVALRINKTDDAADFSDILTDDVLSALRVDLNRSVQVPNAPVAKKTGPKAPQKTRGTASKLSSGMFGITNAQAPTVVDSTETYKTVVRSLIRVTKVLQTTSDNLKLLARMAEYCSVVSEQLCSTRITVADETFECEKAWADTGIPLGSNSTVDATKVCGNIRKGCAQARTDSRECTDTRTHTHTHTTPGVCAVVQSGKTTREKISASADSTRDGISWSVGQAMAFCLEELVHFLDKLRACIIKPGMKQTLNIKLLTSDTEASAKVLKVLEEAAYVIGKLFCVLGKSETISDSTRTAVCEPLSSCFTLATGLRIQLDALDR
ncbi:hypothetical protein SARC_02305 [Sphaeroforma arctica JP610]|uniref:Uncharacterized protein n=1 Tax=Sphaeroforma arctica JP610 TaxID=667725 RepID=A0A0L0GB65_9EUKA|nr:hypothetical protein SARC_02305 [Sphaeroforma arctica JP610]KNC85503.1 hypothetical protein SARC_02305 [Sphaeroforma arctica JP610]|eukprot:XP_014159405.1 hypothetical protein SARC_02305 [Sphaeroforma arctica JP610]